MKRWLLRLSLLAYPRAFRQRFGAEMIADAERLHSTGPWRLVISGMAERRSAWHAYTSSRRSESLYQPQEGRSMLFDTVRADVRQAIRLAAKTPLATALTVAVLALGLGGSTAMFTVVNSVLRRPLPYADADRLVMVWSTNRNEGRDRNTVSPANFGDYRARNRTLASVDYTLSFFIPLAIQGAPDAGIAHVVRTGADIFRVLGRDALHGRTFGANDRQVAVLSHGYWTRALGADPAVVGRSVTFSGNEVLQIVGVMPPDFVFPYRSMLGGSTTERAATADMWVPMPMEGERWRTPDGALVRTAHGLTLFARLRPGVSIDQARADLAAVAAQLETEYPDSNRGWGAAVVPLLEQTVGSIRPALLLLMAGVSVLLLMAAINVANLIGARNLARQREFALRVALGASRVRLAQQALIETLLFSFAGAVCGLLLVFWGVRGFVAWAPAALPRLHEVRPDLSVFWFAAGLALVIGLLVAVLPALWAARSDPRAALQDESRGNSLTAARRRTRTMLVVAQVTLAVVLAIGAALLVRSFTSLLAIDPGFRPENVLTFQINAPDRLTTPDARRAFYETLFDTLRSVPGVVAAGGTTRIPLGSSSVTTSIEIQGRPQVGTVRPEVEFRRSLHDYFSAMGMQILRGRTFTADDGPASAPVAVINQAMARRLFGEEDPVGQHLRTVSASSGPWTQIVGVVGDIRHTSLEADPLPEIYVNYASNPPVAPFLAVRTSRDAMAMAEDVRRALRALEPGMPVHDMQSMEDRRAESTAHRRFVLLLVSAFGALAMLLSATGVYGVMSLLVAERSTEVGVRLALGATPAQVLALMMRHAGRLATLGVGVGVLIALALAPLLASQLFGISSRDAVSFLAAPVCLLLVALVAALIPARRAMRVDPAQAMGTKN